MTTLLVLALLSPIAALVADAVLPSRRNATTAAQAGALVSAGLWLAVLVGGGARAGRFEAEGLVAAACCGSALLLASADLAPRRASRAATVLAVAVLDAGLAAGLASGDVALLTATLLVTGLLVLSAHRLDDEITAAAAAAAIGLVLLGAGLAVAHDATDSWRIPRHGHLPPAALGAFLLGSAALVIAGSLRRRGAEVALVAAGAALGLRVAPLVQSRRSASAAFDVALGVGRAVPVPAVACALVAAAVAAALLARPGPALGLLSLAAVAGVGAPGGAPGLLAAAAVLVAAADRPWAIAAGLPGGVALTLGLTRAGGLWAVALGLGAAAVGVLLVNQSAHGEPADLRPATIPALVVGAWLIVAPGSWAWAGAAALGPYDAGASRAAAAALLLVTAAAARQSVLHAGSDDGSPRVLDSLLRRPATEA